MYETPKLKRVGEAEEVILGLDDVGEDLDGCYIEGWFEFAAEEDFEQN